MSQFIEMFGDPMVNDKQWSEYSCISEITQIVLGSTGTEIFDGLRQQK